MHNKREYKSLREREKERTLRFYFDETSFPPARRVELWLWNLCVACICAMLANKTPGKYFNIVYG